MSPPPVNHFNSTQIHACLLLWIFPLTSLLTIDTKQYNQNLNNVYNFDLKLYKWSPTFLPYSHVSFWYFSSFFFSFFLLDVIFLFSPSCLLSFKINFFTLRTLLCLFSIFLLYLFCPLFYTLFCFSVVYYLLNVLLYCSSVRFYMIFICAKSTANKMKSFGLVSIVQDMYRFT
jgi:hypothetical protein